MEKGKEADKLTVANALVNIARLNNGYIMIADSIPQLIRQGLMAGRSDLDSQRNYVNYCLKRYKNFEPAYDRQGRKVKGTWKLKEHTQFK